MSTPKPTRGDPAPHPEYGPCDGIANGQCAECIRQGLVKRVRPKPMKAWAAWAAVDDDGAICFNSIRADKEDTEFFRLTHERVIPILITPIEGTDLKGSK